MHLLDIAGYLAALDDCRQRFPELRILSGVRDRRGPPVGGQARPRPWPRPARRAGPDPRLAARHPARGAADGCRRPFPSDARRRRDAQVPRRTASAGRGQRPVPGAGAPRLPAADVAAGGQAVRGAGVRGGVPGRAERPGRQRPGPRGEHEEPAGLGRPAALVAGCGGTGGLVRQRRAPPWRVGDKFNLAVDVVEAAGFRPGRDRFDFWRL